MAGTSWPSLTAGKKAKASEVELKFDWIEGDIVPMTGGAQTDGVYYLGTAGAKWLGLYTNSINPTTTAGGVAIGTTTADAGALLDLSGTKALLIPRLSTTQRDALTGKDGMLIFNTTTSQYQLYKTSLAAWSNIGGTVFRTQPPTEASFLTQSVTVTVINVASGGGRIHSIRIKYAGGAFTAHIPTLVLDGVSITLPEANTAGVWYYTPDMAVVRSALTNGTANVYDSNTSFDAPYLGWDFATSAALHIQGPGGANTNTCRVVFSTIV